MPPMFCSARQSSPAKSSASAIGTSGAPCPPAATSRTRKSLTTSMPVRSAITAGFADLPRRVRRFVPERLAVRADRANVGARDAGLGEHGDRRVGEPARRGRSRAGSIRCAVPAAQRARAAASRCSGVYVVPMNASSSASIASAVARREAHDRGGDSVERRARHQPDVDVRSRASRRHHRRRRAGRARGG